MLKNLSYNVYLKRTRAFVDSIPSQINASEPEVNPNEFITYSGYIRCDDDEELKEICPSLFSDCPSSIVIEEFEATVKTVNSISVIDKFEVEVLEFVNPFLNVKSINNLDYSKIITVYVKIIDSKPCEIHYITNTQEEEKSKNVLGRKNYEDDY